LCRVGRMRLGKRTFEKITVIWNSEFIFKLAIGLTCSENTQYEAHYTSSSFVRRTSQDPLTYRRKFLQMKYSGLKYQYKFRNCKVQENLYKKFLQLSLF
jgi:hypothetical protein